MKRYIIGFIISVFVYLFVMSIGHSYYMMQVNKSLEEAVEELVEQIVELNNSKNLQ